MKSMRVVNIMPRPRSQVQTLGRGKYGKNVLHVYDFYRKKSFFPFIPIYIYIK